MALYSDDIGKIWGIVNEAIQKHQGEDLVNMVEADKTVDDAIKQLGKDFNSEIKKLETMIKKLESSVPKPTTKVNKGGSSK